MQKTDSIHTEIEPSLYEVGFHILPSVEEGGAQAEMAKIKAILESYGATIKASEGPSLKKLTYEMVKVTEGKNLGFDSAFFGSIVFETTAPVISEIKTDIEKIPTMLRFILIATMPEALVPREHKVSGKIDAEKYRPEKPAIPAAQISEVELDKKIEEMVIE